MKSKLNKQDRYCHKRNRRKENIFQPKEMKRKILFLAKMSNRNWVYPPDQNN